MKWGKFFKSVLRGLATAATLGLIGRGRKTEGAGKIAGTVLDSMEDTDGPDNNS